ncbi:hypothetical protein ACFE04_024757 [Oxalis oulophora]
MATTSTSTSSTATTTNNDFIKSKCEPARYPPLCVRTFSAYAATINRSHYKLTQTSLSLTLTQANSTKAYISKSRQQAAFKDCKSVISDSVSSLNDAVKEVKQMNGSKGREFAWQKSNVQTWVSAAYTNSDTCLDELAATSGGGDQKLKDSIAYLQKLTSISLTFINNYYNY